MKKTLMFATLLFACSACEAQDLRPEEVPAAVQAALTKAHPQAKHVRWERENSLYEAEFRIGYAAHTVLLDNQGKILEMEEAILVNQLPAPAIAYLDQHHHAAPLKRVEKVTDTYGKVTYEVDIKDLDLYFDAEGKLLRFRDDD